MVVSVDGETVPADAQGGVHLARFSTHEQVLLLRGDVLIVPQPHPKEPAAVMAHMYVPLDRESVQIFV
jgi:ferric-dicitrate binding protein FerR (iron transport regulator)